MFVSAVGAGALDSPRGKGMNQRKVWANSHPERCANSPMFFETEDLSHGRLIAAPTAEMENDAGNEEK